MTTAVSRPILSEATTCTKRGCGAPAGKHTRGNCERHYRQQVRMGIYGWRDGGPTREHVLKLRDLGWTYEQIADEAGVSTWVPHRIVTGATRHVWPESERAVLTVALEPRDSQRSVDSAGTRRRVQALAWMGWPAAQVAARANTTAATLRTLILPTRRISFALSRRVAAVYEELSGVRGPSAGVAAKARQLGHAPPAAWDDVGIDDPKAKPRGIRREVAAKAPSHQPSLDLPEVAPCRP